MTDTRHGGNITDTAAGEELWVAAAVDWDVPEWALLAVDDDRCDVPRESVLPVLLLLSSLPSYIVLPTTHVRPPLKPEI